MLRWTDGTVGYKLQHSRLSMSLKRLLFGFGLALVFAGQALHAQQSDADGKQLAELRAKAEQGNAQSQNELGKAFRLGKFGLTTNFVEAVKWYRKAAEQNLAEAQYSLGFCYAKGEGVAKDEVEAVKWFRRAAEQNYAKAQTGLGYSFVTGQGVEKDYLEAVKWYRKAAEQNLAVAQSNLGFCYAKGEGVAKDEAEAYKWMRLAAAQGNEVAKTEMTELEGKLSQEQIAEGKRRANDWLERRKKSSTDRE
jgi:TPR repeat protein